MDLTDVRDGLVTAAQAITGLRARAWIGDSVEPPLLEVGEVTIDFDAAMARALDIAVVTARLYVGKGSDRAAQIALDGYLKTTGATSVKAALETDRTLAGACQTLRVERVDGYRLYVVSAVTYLGAQFSIRVWG